MGSGVTLGGGGGCPFVARGWVRVAFVTSSRPSAVTLMRKSGSARSPTIQLGRPSSVSGSRLYAATLPTPARAQALDAREELARAGPDDHARALRGGEEPERAHLLDLGGQQPAHVGATGRLRHDAGRLLRETGGVATRLLRRIDERCGGRELAAPVAIPSPARPCRDCRSRVEAGGSWRPARGRRPGNPSRPAAPGSARRRSDGESGSSDTNRAGRARRRVQPA